MPQLHLDPSTSALVLLDLQGSVVSLPTAPLSGEKVVGNAATLAEAFRQKGAAVILVRVGGASDGSDALSPEADLPIEAELAQRMDSQPSGGNEIDTRLGPQEGDLVVSKRQWGAFYGTELDLLLRRRGINWLVLGGIATNFAVESTARDAYERGYEQVFASDVMAALTEDDHDFAVRRILPRIGLVRPTNQIVDALA